MNLTIEQLETLRARLPKPKRHGEVRVFIVPALVHADFAITNDYPVSELAPTEVLVEAITFTSSERGDELRWKVRVNPVL